MSPLLTIPVAFLILFLPGLAFANLSAHSRDRREEPAVLLVDAFGVSLSLLALGGMATFFLGIRFSGAFLWGIAVFLTGGLVFALRRRPGDKESPPAPAEISDALPLLVFAAILLFRIYQARDLVLPAWVDSVHHAQLIRLFEEAGGIPRTLDAAGLVPLYYHAGFHVSAAVFSYFAGLDPAQGLLIFGQLLNAGVSLAVYRLSQAIWSDRRRALTAMLLTGFAFQMPGYYLTWGRYTLLAGIFLLCLAMSAALEGRREDFPRRQLARIAVLTTGLLLVHYYAAVLWAMFLVLFVLVGSIEARSRGDAIRFMRLFYSVGWGTLFALPWVFHVLMRASPVIGVGVVSPAESLDTAYSTGYLDYLWYLLGPYRSHVLHGLGLLGLVLLGWKRQTRSFALFTLVFGLLSLPWGINLEPFRPDHGVILAFLPASIFLADLLVSPLDVPLKPLPANLVRVLFWAALVGVLVWGGLDMASIVNPVTVLADEADLRAMTWIDKNTPESAVFLINTTGWQDGAYRGVDGGWWIMPQTGRATVLPPVIYFMGEKEYVEKVLGWAAQVSRLKTCDDAFWVVVQDSGATHLYLRMERGEMAPGAFIECDGLSLEYLSGGVYIYAVGR